MFEIGWVKRLDIICLSVNRYVQLQQSIVVFYAVGRKQCLWQSVFFLPPVLLHLGSLHSNKHIVLIRCHQNLLMLGFYSQKGEIIGRIQISDHTFGLLGQQRNILSIVITYITPYLLYFLLSQKVVLTIPPEQLTIKIPFTDPLILLIVSSTYSAISYIIFKNSRSYYLNNKPKHIMGYTVTDIAKTNGYVLANGVALLLAYAINYFCHFMIVACYGESKKEETYIQERVLQTSRVLYWFGIATMFSAFPPFFYGLHSAFLGWLTLLFVILMHLFCFIRRWDGQRSVWSYMYYFYHASCFLWMVIALIVAYNWSFNTSVPAGMAQ